MAYEPLRPDGTPLWVPPRTQADEDAQWERVQQADTLTPREAERDRESRAERRLANAQSAHRRGYHTGNEPKQGWQYAANDRLDAAVLAAEDALEKARADRLEREAEERRALADADTVDAKAQATQGDIPEPPKMSPAAQVELAGRLLGPRGADAARRNLSPIADVMEP
jgi:hypothetical protein